MTVCCFPPPITCSWYPVIIPFGSEGGDQVAPRVVMFITERFGGRIPSGGAWAVATVI